MGRVERGAPLPQWSEPRNAQMGGKKWIWEAGRGDGEMKGLELFNFCSSSRADAGFAAVDSGRSRRGQVTNSP